MAAIVAHWDLPAAFDTEWAKKKYFVRWSHAAKAFGITDLRFVEVDEPLPEYGDQEIQLSSYKTLEEALEGLENIVYVEQGGVPVFDFAFPADPVFVFGSDFGELPQADVEIPTATPLTAEVACGGILTAWRMQWP